jgi:outer membrane murein-binding lipoprotein Lpp
MRRLVCAGVCGVFVLAGCNGGTVDRHALKSDSSRLDSIACEGALLAHDVARGRSTVFFAREQAEELRIQSSNFADALSRRKTIPAIRKQVRQEAEHAATLAATLQQLHNHPSDRSVAASVERKLEKLGSCS